MSRSVEVVFSFTLLMCWIGLISGLNNGLAQLPPMGWISRQRFGCNTNCQKYPYDCISENLVKTMADVMATRGFLAAGYNYLILDDCWMDRQRDQYGRLRGDIQRFPSGMADVAKYVHSRGLKFGLYVDLGNETCGGFPGSQGNLNTDAVTLADWGIDYVTVGACGLKDVTLINSGYVAFGRFLNQTGRQIVYACDWPQRLRQLGQQFNMTAVSETCNQFLTFDEMTDNWQSLLNAINYYANYNPSFLNFSSPGSFNYPDELVIGDFGLSINQQQLQMSVWSIMSAPLLVSADLRQITSESREILFNNIALSVDQDPLGMLGMEVRRIGDVRIWQKSILPSGSFAVAIGYTNIAGGPSRVSVRLSDIGITSSGSYRVTEAFSRLEYGIMKPWYTLDCEVNPNGVLLFQFIALY